MLRAADGLPRDPVVLAPVGDLSVPLAGAEPDLLAPVDLVLVFLLHLEDTVHELRKLHELRPGAVSLVDGHGHVGPALNRKPASLAALLAAVADRLRGELADHAARLEALLEPLEPLLADVLALLLGFALELLHQVRPLLAGEPCRGSAGG